MRYLFVLTLAFIFISSPCLSQEKTLLRKAGERVLVKKAAKEAIEYQAKKSIVKHGFKKSGNIMLDQAGKKVLRRKLMDKAASSGCKSLQVYSKKAVRSQLPLRRLSKMRTYSQSYKLRYLKKSQITAKRLQLRSTRYNRGAYGRFVHYRLGICPSNQFISAKQFARIPGERKAKLILGKPKDANVLRENMLIAMGPNKSKYIDLGNNAAHHIVGVDKSLSPSLKKMKKYGIDINEPMNGIFLPTSETSVLKGTKHAGGHNTDYYKHVNSKFSKAKSKEDCYVILDELKRELFDGETPLYNPVSNVVNL